MIKTKKEKSQLMGGPMDATRRGGCLNVFVVLFAVLFAIYINKDSFDIIFKLSFLLSYYHVLLEWLLYFIVS